MLVKIFISPLTSHGLRTRKAGCRRPRHHQCRSATPLCYTPVQFRDDAALLWYLRKLVMWQVVGRYLKPLSLEHVLVHVALERRRLIDFSYLGETMLD